MDSVALLRSLASGTTPWRLQPVGLRSVGVRSCRRRPVARGVIAPDGAKARATATRACCCEQQRCDLRREPCADPTIGSLPAQGRGGFVGGQRTSSSPIFPNPLGARFCKPRNGSELARGGGPTASRTWRVRSTSRAISRAVLQAFLQAASNLNAVAETVALTCCESLQLKCRGGSRKYRGDTRPTFCPSIDYRNTLLGHEIHRTRASRASTSGSQWCGGRRRRWERRTTSFCCHDRGGSMCIMHNLEHNMMPMPARAP